jgi:hypothetical protein
VVEDADDANDMDATRIQKIPSKGNNTGRQVATTTTAPTEPAAASNHGESTAKPPTQRTGILHS